MTLKNMFSYYSYKLFYVSSERDGVKKFIAKYIITRKIKLMKIPICEL